MKLKRYDIVWANLDPTIGAEIKKTRPVVIVSNDLMNKHLQTIVVCPLTTNLHPKWRSRIQVKSAGIPSEIAVDQIRTISKKRLGKKIDKLKPQVAKALRQLITEMYGK